MLCRIVNLCKRAIAALSISVCIWTISWLGGTRPVIPPQFPVVMIAQDTMPLDLQCQDHM